MLAKNKFCWLPRINIGTSGGVAVGMPKEEQVAKTFVATISIIFVIKLRLKFLTAI